MLTRLAHHFDSVITHQGFRRYFANTSWRFAEQILRMANGLLIGIWVARYLGPTQFGIFSYAVAFAAVLGIIAKLGLDNIVVRDLVRSPEQRDIYLGTAFWLKLAGAFISLAAVTLALQFTSSDHTTSLYIFIIASGAIFQSFEVVDFYFQSRVLAKFVSICKLTQLLFSSLLKIYLLLTGADLFWFVLTSLIDQMVLAFSLYFAYRYQNIGNFYRHFDLITARKLLGNSWPLILSGLVIMIYMRIDQIMIKEMLGSREVGLYSVAVRLSELWYFIPVIITSSLFPSIINSKKVSEELYYVRLQRLYTFMVWSAIAIALPFTFLSDWLVTLLYGEAYRPAATVLKIHIWTNVFVFLGVASSSWLTNQDLQMFAFYRTFIGALLNIIMNLVLIPAYGMIGAAIATLIAQVMAAFVFDAFSEKTRIAFVMKLKTLYFADVFQKGRNAEINF